ncbi:MAG: SMC-Scp complex subunit ScpB [Candidatus Omnitrophica bacterium]|nr:SMC-Scp complex subunit ScpB [Candidatus Omnitrophota bacterium]MBU1924431.1 SMC-Scp complex subunit ScpB [Candidatus Omnitrophota bacterium]
MDENELKKHLEAVLFVSDKPLSLKQLTEVFEGADSADIKEALKKLKEEYNEPGHGVQIAEIAGGYQYSTHPDCAEYLKKLYKNRRVWRLSSPALETVAIIAYKQPITRAEIEFIRGVNVDGVIRTLLERGLIKIKGKKDVPGRPILYGTTEEFLKYFGLKNIGELPLIETFVPQALERGSLESEGEIPKQHEEQDDVKNLAEGVEQDDQDEYSEIA